MDIEVLRYCRNLKRDFPLKYPVRVRTAPNLNYRGLPLYGATYLTSGIFTIYLLREAEVTIQIDTLWHEWAHCLLWPKYQYRHTRVFWHTYGRIYSLYQD